MKRALKFSLALTLVLVLLAGSVVFAQGEGIEIGLEAKYGRYKAWSVVAEDKLFIFGGNDFEEPTPTEYYDFLTGEWGEYGLDSRWREQRGGRSQWQHILLRGRKRNRDQQKGLSLQY